MENRQDFPGALPQITSGWSGDRLDLLPGEGFWARIEQIAVKGEMTRGLDTVMKGQSSPRIWLFLHPQGRSELSAAVAMSFARELAFRDQAALVLDGDDQDQALTRWVGRVEYEGWIDLARYGTSVLTSGIPMPFVGRRGYLLGVGSFAPTDVTGEEIDTLLTRLRRQADDLLIVAPADALGRLWAPGAGIRVLCWDRQEMSGDEAGALAADFAEAGCPLTAVVTFQDSGAAEEMLVDEVLAEATDDPETAEARPPAAEDVSEESPDESPEEIPAVDQGEAQEDVPVASGNHENWRDLPLEQEAAPGEPFLEERPEEPVSVSVPGGGGETSRVFWFGALTALVVIAAVTVYYFKFVRVPSEGHFEQIEVAAEAEPSGTGLSGGSAEATLDESAARDMGATAVADSVAAADSVIVPAVEESVAEVSRPQTEPVSASAPDSIPVAGTTPDEAGFAGGTPGSETVAQPAAFDMGPYREPVGTGGWALHVYSLPDSLGTAKQVRELDRRGFESAVRIFDLGDKGRWRRIYLGSFASRTEAKAAMPALLEKLRVDWAKAERFTNSAPE